MAHHGQPRPAFRPWNSFLAKKGVAEAASIAAAHALREEPPAVKRLTAGLIDTYEGINHAYYHSRQPNVSRQYGGTGGIGAAGGGVDSSTAVGSAARRVGLLNGKGSLGRAGGADLGPGTSVASGSGQSEGSGFGGESSTGSELRKASLVDAVAAGKLEGLAAKVEKCEIKDDAVAAQAQAQATDNSGEEETGVNGGQRYCDENFDYIVRPGDLFHNRYMLEKVIGRGSFGQVVRAYDTRTKAHVAIKIIKNNALYVEQALSEVRMTAYLNRIDPDDDHAIMRIFDKFIFRGHQCLVLELLSFSLYDLLRSTEFYGVSLNLVRKFSRQVLNCLAFLSRDDVSIAHCDLKPENVLLRHPQRSAIKVVDFGAACRVSDNMFTYVQSRFYRAPEVILGLPYTTQVDVWSLGCMLVELHTGYPLFAGRDEADQMAVIVERLGMPPKHMLDAGKKTGLFFDLVDDAGTSDQPAKSDGVSGGEWVLKTDIARKGDIVPGSKPIQSFVDDLTSGSSGKRKRVSGGHSESDYEVFLQLASDMLRFDPDERITSAMALKNSFVSGASVTGRKGGSAGRDSPPPMQAMGVAKLSSEFEPGRAAPVQRSKNGEVSTASSGSGDMGGALRLSKSESAIAPVPVPMLVFHSSDWAEEVGIEPPLWRAGPAGPGGAALAHLRGLDPAEDEESLACADKVQVLPCAGRGRPVRSSGRLIKARPPTNLPTIFGEPVNPRVLARLRTARRLPSLDTVREGVLVPSGHCAPLRRVQCI